MEQKPWWKSKTLISLIVAGASAFAPKYAPLISDLAGPVLDIVSQATTLVSLAGAAYFRVNAKTQLTAKKPAESV